MDQCSMWWMNYSDLKKETVSPNSSWLIRHCYMHSSSEIMLLCKNDIKRVGRSSFLCSVYKFIWCGFKIQSSSWSLFSQRCFIAFIIFLIQIYHFKFRFCLFSKTSNFEYVQENNLTFPEKWAFVGKLFCLTCNLWLFSLLEKAEWSDNQKRICSCSSIVQVFSS